MSSLLFSIVGLSSVNATEVSRSDMNVLFGVYNANVHVLSNKEMKETKGEFFDWAFLGFTFGVSATGCLLGYIFNGSCGSIGASLPFRF